MQMDAEANGLKLLNTQLLQQLQTTQRALQQVTKCVLKMQINNSVVTGEKSAATDKARNPNNR